MTSWYVTSGNEAWQFGELISQDFRKPKKIFFNISPRAQLAYKIYPIKFYREWPNLNTVKISFCKVAMPLFKFAIKDLKTTEKHQNKATLPIISTLYHKRRGQLRRISADPKNRNVKHTKKHYDDFIHWLWFFPWFIRPIRVVREPSPLVISFLVQMVNLFQVSKSRDICVSARH